MCKSILKTQKTHRNKLTFINGILEYRHGTVKYVCHRGVEPGFTSAEPTMRPLQDVDCKNTPVQYIYNTSEGKTANKGV